MNKVKSNLFFGGIIVLLFTDMFFIGKRFLSDDDFVTHRDYNAYFNPSPTDQQILQDKSLDYRVLNFTTNTFNESHTSYFHNSVGGYHAAKLRRYQELIENQISKQNTGVFDMMNTKYFIVSAGKDKGTQAEPNYTALGNAWFPDSVMMVANADEEMNRIGNMYQVKMLDGTEFTENGKKVTSALIGYHDNVKIDTVTFDASSFHLFKGMTDTLGILQGATKEGIVEKYIAPKSKGATEKLFSVTHFYEFNPRTHAIIDKRFEDYLKGFVTQADSSCSIKLLSYQPNDLVYESKTSKEDLAVFSEIY